MPASLHQPQPQRQAEPFFLTEHVANISRLVLVVHTLLEDFDKQDNKAHGPPTTNAEVFRGESENAFVAGLRTSLFCCYVLWSKTCHIYGCEAHVV